MLTLTLAGSEVDLPADAEVALTLWAHDLRNSASREATFSETFTLPPSARNSVALGAAHVLGSQSDAPYQKLPAVLRAGGIALPIESAVLEGISSEGYEVTLYGPTADLHALVKDRKLRELDLSAYTHALTHPNVALAQDHDYTQGYTYPLVDDGRLGMRDAEVNGAVLYHEVPPFVYWHTLLAQIVAECLPGYTLTGSLLAEDRYRRAGYPRARPWPALSQARRDGLALRARRTVEWSAEEPNGNDGKAYPVLSFPDVVSQGDEATWATAQYFVVPNDLPCDVSVTAELLLTVYATANASRPVAGGLPSRVAARVVADPNGLAGPAATQVVLETVVWEGYVLNGTTTAAYPVRQRVTLDATAAHLRPGSIVAVQFYLYWGMGVRVHEGGVRFAVGERTYAGGPVDLAASLPDKSQADFLQQLANTFQLIPQADPVLRTVRFDLFTDLERNRPRAVDWTAKLDRTNGPATGFRLDAYAQRNRYTHDAPPEAYDALLRSDEALTLPGYLPVADTTLPDAADAYASPTFAVQAHAALGGRQLAWLPAVGPAGLGYHVYDNGKVYRKADGPVVFGGRYWQNTVEPAPGITPPGAGVAPDAGATYLNKPVWTELPEAQVLSVLNDELAAVALVTPAVAVGIALAGDDQPPGQRRAFTFGLTAAGLDWATDLLPTYYPTLQALLTRARVLRLPFTLGAADVNTLDFTVPVKLDVLFWPGVGPIRGLFYVNQVENWSYQTGPTTVELVKLGEPVLGIAPPAISLPERPERMLLQEIGLPLLQENTDYLLEE